MNEEKLSEDGFYVIRTLVCFRNEQLMTTVYSLYCFEFLRFVFVFFLFFFFLEIAGFLDGIVLNTLGPRED